MRREHWASRLGLILATAGSAVGLGNFLRFPSKAVYYGGGAFMIPYFAALLFLGIPLMWAEWAMGRFGGVRGHGTSPGIFKLMWPSRVSKYIGALGIALPLAVLIYYTYIESWTLAYSWFSITGKYSDIQTREGMGQFLGNFTGAGGDYTLAYVFVAITLLVNFVVLYRGISRGIELLARIAMPALFLFAVVLVVRVFTLGTPNPAYPDRNVLNGLAFLWNPDLSQLRNPQMWLEATGQIFFTLSIGFGVIQTYASYLRKHDDVALNGLSTAATNEFAEVILGGSIAIPLAFIFFGSIATMEIAKAGTFNLGFMSMPLVFGHLPIGKLLGALWFGLLFLAGITSSVSLAQPAIAFLEDELGWSRQKAVITLFAFIILVLQFVILAPGFLDEMDFWTSSAGIVIFGTIEIILFGWIFGINRGWEELTRGADIKVPKIFYYIIKYITPVYLLTILIGWIGVQGIDVITNEQTPWKWLARFTIFVIFLIIVFLIRCSRRLRSEVAENG